MVMRLLRSPGRSRSPTWSLLVWWSSTSTGQAWGQSQLPVVWPGARFSDFSVEILLCEIVIINSRALAQALLLIPSLVGYARVSLGVTGPGKSACCMGRLLARKRVFGQAWLLALILCRGPLVRSPWTSWQHLTSLGCLDSWM